MVPTSTDRYHHGDLPAALRAAAADLLAERGAAGFSLREVARRAGVSHAAPTHHFGDATGLLTSVATEAFDYLSARTQAAVDGVDDPVEALVALGRAYVAVAIEHPGHCAIAFRTDAVNADDAAYRAASETSFSILHATVNRLTQTESPDLDVDLAAALCWSTVQGLLTVHAPLVAVAARSGQHIAPIEDLAEALTRLLIAGLSPSHADRSQ